MPATIGVAELTFAKTDTEPKDTPATYAPAVRVGGAVQVNLTINLASGQDYADNQMSEDVNVFVSGSAATEIDNIDLETEAVIFGSTYDENTGELGDSSLDSPPYGSLAYYQLKQIGGVNVFRGVFYPKARAALSPDNASTKNASISFQHSNPNFTIFQPNVGNWRYRQEFESEAEVLAWIDEKRGVSKTTP